LTKRREKEGGEGRKERGEKKKSACPPVYIALSLQKRREEGKERKKKRVKRGKKKRKGRHTALAHDWSF